MIKVDCTHCQNPIKDVYYSLLARDVEDPAQTIGGQGIHLHYECVPEYFGWVKVGHQPTQAVLSEVALERGRQDEKWGEQNHPDGTGPDAEWLLDDPHPGRETAEIYRKITQAAARDGVLTWRDILLEEVAGALAEADPAKLRAELVQAVAVGVAWIEKIDRHAVAERENTWLNITVKDGGL
jgi:hypothetical protein